MSVMDGKSIKHRVSLFRINSLGSWMMKIYLQKCALVDCRNPLVNFKNGRFCEDHLHLRNVCGIIPCGLPIESPGALTCSTASHIEWYKKWTGRFKRLTYPGVRRVIRRQNEAAEQNGGISAAANASVPTLQIELPSLNNSPGDKVVHTFQAGRIYCVQTIQWACGYPIGWGKCYKSESKPQVLSIIDRVWENDLDSKPSFIAYDDACDLLRHIVTQDPDSHWIKTTAFCVDAWHYIGHRATDVLCRVWCNPAPTNGSQPDLMVAREDANGQVHTTRAFNTETAEQLNAWLDGFESQLSQMTDVNFDFYLHVLFLLFGEMTEERVRKQGLELPEDFWDM